MSRPYGYDRLSVQDEYRVGPRPLCRAVVMHGADSNCYNGVRDDPYGMDLQYAGMHGQAYGNGFYFGLSDHVTLGYNREGKPGTALRWRLC